MWAATGKQWSRLISNPTLPRLSYSVLYTYQQPDCGPEREDLFTAEDECEWAWQCDCEAGAGGSWRQLPLVNNPGGGHTMNWWVYGNMLGMNINVVTLSVAADQGTAPDRVIHMSVWLYLIQESLAQASTAKSPSHNNSKQSFVSHVLSHHPASHKWLELIAVRAKHSGMWRYMCESLAAEEHQSPWSQHVSKEDWVQLLTPDMFFS